MMRVPIAAGVVAGLLAFAAWRGADLLPVFFFAGLIGGLAYIGRNRLGGGKSFAIFAPAAAAPPAVLFDDIGGQEVAKKELQEALEFIRNAEGIRRLGIRPLKGILLEGPPGTGKTLLAKAAARYTDSAFVAASGSEFVEMYVGVGAQRVRQLFKDARRQAARQNKESAVVFIDEIEVLGGKRGKSSGHLEYDQTLNELLVQMDGLTTDEEVRVLLIAATNRADMLDPALTRPGRFDRQVRVDLPDKAGRRHILALHTRNKPLAADADLDEIAAATFGFSGAHLESLVNEAAIGALRDGAATVDNAHLRGAIDKVILGERLDRLPGPAEKRRIAVHEAGHALAGELYQPGSVASVNVAARGKALGYVRHTAEDDRYLHTAADLKNRIAVALAGSVAEELILGDRSTGAASDFAQAADLARQLVHGGMSELGIISPADLPAEMLHRAVAGLLHGIEADVHALLAGRVSELEGIVAELADRESLTGDEFRALLGLPAATAA